MNKVERQLYMKTYRQKNKKRIKEVSIKYYQQTWAKIRELRYGLSEINYQKLVDQQSNLCKICKNKSSKSLHVDHCHKTKKVRGLLCGSCNRALGLFKDNFEICLNAANYLKGH